jgi:uncharacterized membrane protein YdbT with pleckstrin-like domain
MNHEILFTSRTSQFTNVIAFLITCILTGASIFFKDTLSSITEQIFGIISNFTEMPEITTSALLYVILTIVWLKFIWKILAVHNLYYDFEEERIVLHFGVLNKETDYIEYFRIKDYTIKRPLIARLAGLHNLEIVSTDRSHPYLHMQYLTNFKDREPELRKGIEKAGATGRGREVDVV